MLAKNNGRSCANNCDLSVIGKPRDYLTTTERCACVLSVIFVLVEAWGWAVRNGLL